MEEVDDADLYGQISADEVKQIANNQKQDKAQSQASSATAASKIGALQLSSDELMNDANEDFYDEDQDDFVRTCIVISLVPNLGCVFVFLGYCIATNCGYHTSIQGFFVICSSTGCV